MCMVTNMIDSSINKVAKISHTFILFKVTSFLISLLKSCFYTCVETHNALFLMTKHIIRSKQNRKLKHTTTTITSISPSSKMEICTCTHTLLLVAHTNKNTCYLGTTTLQSIHGCHTWKITPLLWAHFKSYESWISELQVSACSIWKSMLQHTCSSFVWTKNFTHSLTKA